MHSLQKQFHDFIQKEDLLKKEDNVLLAVSGGVDSMVMADLFLQSGHSFTIAHCNFNLRGEESDGDEVFVKNWGVENDVRVHTKSFDLEEGSVQLHARESRYRWFEELCAGEGYTKVAVAHHLDDSIETVLINLTRGTGIRGLSGIKPKSGNIIRPLLFASRMDLEDYAKDQTLSWREDSSNAKAEYDRNLIRLEIIPKLQKLNPSLQETFRNTLERLKMTDELLTDKAEEVGNQYLENHGGYFELNLDWASDHQDQLILAELLSDFGVNYVTAREIFEARGKSGKEFPGKTWTIFMDRASLFIKPSVKIESSELSITETGVYEFEGKKLSLVLDDYAGGLSQDGSEGWMDADQVTFPLTFRRWEKGDRFKPLGMKGTKKVSDYLIDQKIPIALKDVVPVLISKDEIIWLAGHQIAEKVKITDQTTRVLKVSLS